MHKLPKTGFLFPKVARTHSKHRASRFIYRLASLGITGVSLHSYRSAWAERAKTASIPERFVQQALGHTSIAVARSYSKKAPVKIPSLEKYEQMAQVVRPQPQTAHP